MSRSNCNWKLIGKIAAAVLAVAAVVAVLVIFRGEICRLLSEAKEKLPTKRCCSELDDFEDV